MPLLDTQKNKKPSFYTFDILTKKLSGFTGVEDLSIKNNGAENEDTYVFKFNKQDKPIYILWADMGAKYNISLSGSGESKILVTYPITTHGKTTPETKIFLSENGSVSLDLTTNPIFAEEIN